MNLDLVFGGDEPVPYEVLLHAALIGNQTRFARQDGVEQEWRIVQPLLDNPPPVQTYQPGSWGPAAADQLVAAYGGWREPWTENRPSAMTADVVAPPMSRRQADHSHGAHQGVRMNGQYDVIIIGSGAGGGTLAHTLASVG